MVEHEERDEGEDDGDDGAELGRKEVEEMALSLEQDEFCEARMTSVDGR